VAPLLLPLLVPALAVQRMTSESSSLDIDQLTLNLMGGNTPKLIRRTRDGLIDFLDVFMDCSCNV
jgi:hypothetical protein